MRGQKTWKALRLGGRTKWSRYPTPRLALYFAKKWWSDSLGIHNDTNDIAPRIPNPYATPKNGTILSWLSLLQIPSSRRSIYEAVWMTLVRCRWGELPWRIYHPDCRPLRTWIATPLLQPEGMVNWTQPETHIMIEPALANFRQPGTNVYRHHQNLLQQYTDHRFSRYRVSGLVEGGNQH